MIDPRMMLGVLAGVTLAASTAFAQPRHNGGRAPVPINWINGQRTVSAPHATDLAEVLAGGQRPSSGRHVVVQFDTPLTPAQRHTLEQHGLQLLDYLGSNAWFATVSPKIALQAVIQAAPLSGAQSIDRTMRVHHSLLGDDLPPRAVVGGDPSDPWLALYVILHRDVNLQDGTAFLTGQGARLRSLLHTVNGAVIEAPASLLPVLAEIDTIKWIEPPILLGPVNDDNRVLTQAEVVQAPPYELDGSGITVLVYDVGSVHADHPDFGQRVTLTDDTAPHAHSTHVAATVGGSGAESNGLYRGMAPAVTLLSDGLQLDFDGLPLYSDPGDLEQAYRDGINIYGADLATNSIGTNVCQNILFFDCDVTGDYGVASQVIDAAVHGSLGQPFRVVFANGNERTGDGTCDRCIDEGVHTPEGFHSTAPPACAKNHITVGAVYSNSDGMTPFSSWGPCDDGRLKPDVVAPGAQSDGDFGVTSACQVGDGGPPSAPCQDDDGDGFGYRPLQGTSMAAPTLSGLAALLLQDYAARYPQRPAPRNATLKVLFTHTAEDAVDRRPGDAGTAPLWPGPDYQTGYGSVRIQPAIDLMRSGRFFEDLVDHDHTVVFLVDVADATERLKVTLAWDDVPAVPNVATALINDLDLRAIDPDGNLHFPWTLDPLNPGAPAVRDHPDHQNNIEQVAVDDPLPGLWHVEVAGFDVPQGPQPFSICGSPGLSRDCDGNGVPDDQQIQDDPALDCTANGILDPCEPDCNGNQVADTCDLLTGTSLDCDSNNVPDECQPDCDQDGTPDACELTPPGDSQDCDNNGIPDECQDTAADCNDNFTWDACDIADGSSDDLNHNGVPDECEVQGQILYVDACEGLGGSGTPLDPFCKIQLGINAALPGDTVMLADGLYAGPLNTNLDFFGKDLTVRSHNGPQECIIDGGGTARAFIFRSNETAAARVQDITVQNGWHDFWGGGMYAVQSSPTISGCVFRNNAAIVAGGFYTRESSARLIGCRFESNIAFQGGAILNGDDGHTLIEACRFIGNLAYDGGGAIRVSDGDPTIRNCLFVGNQVYGEDNGRDGGAVHVQFGDLPLLEGCTMVGNFAAHRGGAVFIAGSGSGGAVMIRDCILRDNLAAEGPQLFVENTSQAEVQYSNIMDPAAGVGGAGMVLWGPGNLDVDPLFGDPQVEDYHLPPTSPCIDAGTPAAGAAGVDFDGEPRVQHCRRDIGADESPFFADCNDNDQGDACDIAVGISEDCPEAGNWIPDECEPDCDADGIVDSCAIALEISPDCNGNGVPDGCDIATQASTDCNANDIPDDCDVDPDGDGVPELDCDGNGVLDECDLAGGHGADCNHNGMLDECDIAGDSDDFNHNGVPDLCDPHKVLHVDAAACPELGTGAPHDPFCRIQDAIDAAISWDTVVVADGVYSGPGNLNLDFGGRRLILRSLRGPEHCTIDCRGSGERGVYFHLGEDGHSVLQGFTITNCTAIEGAAVYCQNSSPVIRDCVLSNNRATRGGAMAFKQSKAQVFGCRILDNQADGPGGGIHVTGNNSEIRLASCLIAGNSSVERGGGLFVIGAGLDVAVVHSTVIGNRAPTGGGLAVQSLSAPSTVGSLDIINCILWNNRAEDGQGPQAYISGSAIAVVVDYCGIEDGLDGVDTGILGSPGVFQWGGSNLSLDPAFAAAGQWDDHGTPELSDDVWLHGDPHLTSGSPLIDAGDDTAVLHGWGDFDRQPRIMGVAVDIGADEFVSCPGDLNGDGRVGAADLGLMLGDWGPCLNCPGDLNGDGTVDAPDAALLIARWGMCLPS